VLAKNTSGFCSKTYVVDPVDIELRADKQSTISISIILISTRADHLGPSGSRRGIEVHHHRRVRAGHRPLRQQGEENESSYYCLQEDLLLCQQGEENGSSNYCRQEVRFSSCAIKSTSFVAHSGLRLKCQTFESIHF
jgi:hypothetical protein